jgi:hypothetical protein
MKTEEQNMNGKVCLVTGVTGRYFVKEKSIPSSKISYDLDFCRRLWDISSELITQQDNELSFGKVLG